MNVFVKNLTRKKINESFLKKTAEKACKILKKEVELAIKESGAVGQSDTGKVMSILMPKLKGKADGGLVSKMVGELLK